MKGRAPSFLRKAALALAAAAALALSSCAHRPMVSPSGFWFQHLAKEGAATFTTTDEDLIGRLAGVPDFAKRRLCRLSALIDGGRFIALVECGMGEGLFNSAMAVSQEWNKSAEEDCYTNAEGRVKLNLLQDDLILVTNGSYAEAKAFVEDSVFTRPAIDEGTALAMAASDSSFHSFRPKRLPMLSILPESASLTGIEEIAVCLGKDGLNLKASFDSEDLCRAFNKIFKLNYIALLKKSGFKVEISKLRNQIVEEGRTLAASGLLLPGEESSKLFRAVMI